MSGKKAQKREGKRQQQNGLRLGIGATFNSATFMLANCYAQTWPECWTHTCDNVSPVVRIVCTKMCLVAALAHYVLPKNLGHYLLMVYLVILHISPSLVSFFSPTNTILVTRLGLESACPRFFALNPGFDRHNRRNRVFNTHWSSDAPARLE